MRLHAPGTFITDPLFYIPQKEKIAPTIAAKIVRVNRPKEIKEWLALLPNMTKFITKMTKFLTFKNEPILFEAG